MIVVAIIGLLAAIAIPNFVKARTTAQTNACINNLRQISGAVETWALENRKVPTDAVADADIFGAALYIKSKPTCPAGGTYSLPRSRRRRPAPSVARTSCHSGSEGLIQMA